MYKNTYTTSTASNTTFGSIKTTENIYNTCTAGDTYTVSEDGITKIVSEEISIQYNEEEAPNLPDCCKNCPNRPSKQNGYTSICLCALPALTNPITV